MFKKITLVMSMLAASLFTTSSLAEFQRTGVYECINHTAYEIWLDIDQESGTYERRLVLVPGSYCTGNFISPF